MSHKTLYLHIGTNKTGTTAIQDYLLQHRESLKDHGVLYPVSGCTRLGNHSPLARDLQESLLQERPSYKWDRLQKEIKNSKAPTVVLSGEVFYTLSREPFRKLVRDLKQHFSDIRIVCYVRRQDDYLRACYTQGIKMGRVGESFSEYRASIIREKKLRAYRYARSLKKWANAFGVEHVIVRPFEPGQLHHGDIVSDFCDAIKLPEPLHPVEPSVRLNRSPGERVVKAMQWVRGLLPPLGSDRESRRYVAMCVLLASRLCDEWEDEPFIGFAPGEAEDFCNLFRDENRQVAQQYLGREDGVLFHEPPGQKTATPGLHLSEQDQRYVRRLLEEGLEQMVLAAAMGRPLASVWTDTKNAMM